MDVNGRCIFRCLCHRPDGYRLMVGLFCHFAFVYHIALHPAILGYRILLHFPNCPHLGKSNFIPCQFSGRRLFWSYSQTTPSICCMPRLPCSGQIALRSAVASHTYRVSQAVSVHSTVSPACPLSMPPRLVSAALLSCCNREGGWTSTNRRSAENSDCKI